MKLRNVLLTLTVLALVAAGAANAQTLIITQSPTTIFAQAGGPTVTASLSFTSSDNGATSIPFAVSSNVAWITPAAAPANGWKTPATVLLTINPSTLQPGQNTGSLSIFSTQFQTVNVTVTVSSLSVVPQTINLNNYQIGSNVFPQSQTITVIGANGNFTVSKAPADNWYTAAAFGNPLSAVLISFNAAAASTLTPSATPLQGTLTITPSGGNNPVPITVPISLTVTASPSVTVNPTSLVFNWQALGTNNQNKQIITLTSNAPQTINFAISAPGVNWITLPQTNPTSIPAGGSTQVVVQVDGSNQQQGTTNGSILVTVAGALFPNNTTQLSIPVQLNVSNFPLLYASPSALTFAYQFGSSTLPNSQVVTATSSGAPNQQLQYIVSVPGSDNWISTAPSGALTTGASPFTVSVNTTGLPPGTYNSTVTITPFSNGSNQTSVKVPVTLTISFANILQVNTTQLVFPYQVGQSAPAPQSITLSSSTGSPLSYTVTPPNASTAPWISVAGSLTGLTDQTSFTVSINPAGIPNPPPPNFLDATINISATDLATGNAVNSIAIDVKLYVSANPVLVVTPPSPLIFATYPTSPTYPLSQTANINLTGSSSLPGDQLTITSITKSVTNQATTGNWLGGTSPSSATPTSFTVNGTDFPDKMPAGTYTGTVGISANGSNAQPVANSPVTLPAIFTVYSAKGSLITPQADGSVQFTQTKGGTAPAAQTVQVRTDGVSLPFQAVVNTGLLSWLTVTNATGPTPGQFNVSADASNLTTGVYKGAIYVTIPNAAGSPFRIPVTFTVTGGAISASAQSLSFTQIIGGPAPAAQTVQITSTPSSVAYTIASSITSPTNGNWLQASITAGSGTTPGTVTVSVTPGNLAAGTYNGTVTITSAGASGSPIAIPVSLTVQQATLSTNAPAGGLTFNQLAGGTAPAAQTFNVSATPAPIGFTISTSTANGVGWLLATVGGSGNSGTTPGTVQVSVSAGSLAPGPYSGQVTITSPNAIGSPITIPVLLNVGTAAVISTNVTSLTFSAVIGQATTPQTVTLSSSTSTTYSTTVATKDNGSWLSVSPASGSTGTTPVTLTISANTQNLTGGNYSGTITITSPNALAPVTINVGLTVQAIPTPVITTVTNAASYVAGAVSPGENITISGSGIGPTPLATAKLDANGKLSTLVGNTQVLFDGIPAPVYYSSDKQTSVFVPYEIAGRATTNIQVIYSGVPSSSLQYTVTQAIPGIYTLNQQGFGPAVILNQDQITINGPNAPAAKGSVITLYVTGEGATNPASTTGGVALSGSNGLNKPILPVTATIGGQPASVEYSGSAPFIVYGVMQVNLRIPTNIGSGAQTLVINVGSASTRSDVTVAVQ